MCCLKPPEEGAREPTELKQLLLTGLDGSKPAGETQEGRRGRGGEERVQGSRERGEVWGKQRSMVTERNKIGNMGKSGSGV